MTNNDAPVIQISKVSKVYRTGASDVHALRGVDLTVGAGEMVAVMGSSGSGKSTLMNILGCLDVPSEGSYVLDGVRVDNLSKNQLADLRNQKLGFVFQGFNLLARRRWPESASASGWTTSRASSRAGSSSAWRSPARW